MKYRCPSQRLVNSYATRRAVILFSVAIFCISFLALSRADSVEVHYAPVANLERVDVELIRTGLVLNRKNALFAGHDQGTENWACIALLIETCKLQGVDPQTYFTDVLAKLVNLWPASRLDELMPWTWAAERPNNKLAA
jgi:hypothetical protein